MGQPVTRLYDNESLALDAVSDLKESGFASGSIDCVAASGVKGTATDDGIVVAIEAIGVSKAAAAVYAEEVRRGRVVVSVKPNFGSARRATAILDKFNPIAVAVSEEAPSKRSKTVPNDPNAGWEGAAPLSEKLNWAVLLDDPTPLSTKADWPLISDNATPLSDKLGLSVLTDDATPFSKWARASLLRDDPTPLSSWLKRPLLSDRATPFSDWLQVPLLLDDAAPLSNWLKWPVKR